jgi:hypothetical protein
VRLKLLTAASAAALTLSLLSGAPVLAQAQQLDESTVAGLENIGIDTAGLVISEDQAGQIEDVLASGDEDAVKRAQVEEILGGPAAATGQPGSGQLPDSAATDLAQLGIDTEGVGTLSQEQLASIENVMASNDSDEIKRAQIEDILGEGATATDERGVTQLQDSVMTDLARLGVDTSAVETLTVSQLAELQNVLASTDSDQEKQRQAEEILVE